MEIETVEGAEAPEDNIANDIAEAMKELEAPEAEPERGEDGKFKSTEVAEENPEEIAPQIPAAPQSWGAAVKDEWANIPARAREEILKRENDIHQAMTRNDGDLRLGRDIKEIVTPYMPLIQAAGSTPAATINNLLNTVYKLKTGDENTKVSIIQQIAKDYGVKLPAQDEQEYVDPTIAALQREIEQLKHLANPQAIETRLTERLENSKIESHIAAFASDPAHVHYEVVKPIMAALLGSNQAKDLKEAYDMACMAHPQIRSTLEAAKAAEQKANRTQELQAKKRAASSITGSPATSSNSKVNNSKASVEDDLRAAFDEFESRV